MSKWIDFDEYSELRRFVTNPGDTAPHIETLQVRCFGIHAAPNHYSACESSKTDILEALDIKASIEADLADPEWRASMARSATDIRAGRVLPARIALMPLPGWAFHILFTYIAPWTWGRRTRRMARPNGANPLRSSDAETNRAHGLDHRIGD